MIAALILAALPLAAADLGGHPAPPEEPAASEPRDDRRATLEEMWQRRILPPDQTSWSPKDMELLQKIRRVERDALSYLSRSPGGERPWTARPASGLAAPKLTKEGCERYFFLATQDAIAYFESKGAEARGVFRLRDWEGRPMFDKRGLATEAGLRVYELGRLNLEVFWRGAGGEVYGTRRPPAKGSPTKTP